MTTVNTDRACKEREHCNRRINGLLKEDLPWITAQLKKVTEELDKIASTEKVNYSEDHIISNIYRQAERLSELFNEVKRNESAIRVINYLTEESK